MAKLPRRTIRDLRIAARDGDRVAIRTLLRRDGFAELASEVRRGKPIPPRVRKQVAALTAGTGTHDQPGEWEFINEQGEIENLLMPEPSLPRRPRLRTAIFEEEDQC
jgi:hypothetical protein